MAVIRQPFALMPDGGGGECVAPLPDSDVTCVAACVAASRSSEVSSFSVTWSEALLCNAHDSSAWSVAGISMPVVKMAPTHANRNIAIFAILECAEDVSADWGLKPKL